MVEGKRFSVFGQFEYCDIFGTYHCQGFSTNYLPNIKQFVPSPALPCVFEPIGPTERPGKGYKEIEPCEQPNEPEYIEAVAPVLAPTPSTLAAVRSPHPLHRIDVPLLSVFLNRRASLPDPAMPRIRSSSGLGF